MQTSPQPPVIQPPAPPITGAGYPRETEAPEPRNYIGWVLLAVLFLLTLTFAIMGSMRAPSEESRFGPVESALRMAFDLDKSLGSLGGSQKSESLKTVLTMVEPKMSTSPRAADIWLAVKYELKTLPAAKSFPPRATPGVKAIYAEPKLTKAQLKAVNTAVKGNSFSNQLIRAHAAAKAGDPDLLKALGKQKTAGLLMVVLGGLAIFLGCVIGVIGLIALHSAGNLRAPGGPQEGITLAQADRLALRAAQIFLAFLGISLLVSLVAGRRFEDPMVDFVTGFLIILWVISVSRLRIDGKMISLDSLGVNRRNLGRNIGLGLLGFVIELPIALIIGAIGQRVFSFLPEPHHPAADAIPNATGLGLLATLFSAAVVAPFWEEIMFRGLLFPALARVTNKTWMGAALSSLLFAAIHPQGIALWLALGTVAVASCILVHYSKSLVPSIVMHAAHNLCLLTVSIALYR